MKVAYQAPSLFDRTYTEISETRTQCSELVECTSTCSTTVSMPHRQRKVQLALTFDVRVTIKRHLKRKLVFGLQSRLAIGIILGYVGLRHEVLPLMQVLSHSTRAYIWNADGL